MAIGMSMSITGLPELQAVLSRIKVKVDTDIKPVNTASGIMFASVMRNFAEQGRPVKWAGLSPLTKFIRSHRQSKPNTNPLILQDTGILKNSNFPFYNIAEGVAGVRNTAEYASLMNDGGESASRDIVIGSFYRKRPPGEKAILAGFSAKRHAEDVHVKSYTMHLKGGTVTPRRFMVVQREDYPVLKAVFADWLKGINSNA